MKGTKFILWSSALVALALFAVDPAQADDRRYSGRRGTAGLRQELYRDRAEIRDSRNEFRRDLQELARDRRELRQDLRNGASRAEIARDRAEVRESRQEVQESRRELNRDLNEYYRDLNDYRWHTGRYDRDDWYRRNGYRSWDDDYYGRRSSWWGPFGWWNRSYRDR